MVVSGFLMISQLECMKAILICLGIGMFAQIKSYSQKELSRGLSEENFLFMMSQSNFKKSNMEELLKRIVDTGIQNLISDRRLYVHPPTRKERRKRERELKKK